MTTLKDEIWQALKAVPYPGYDRDIASSGLVQRVAACDGLVTVDLSIGHLGPELRRDLVTAVQDAIHPLPGVEALKVGVGQPVDVRPRMARTSQRATSRPAGVHHVIAVGSGKGGVGKSTVAANLAVALAQQGVRVGLMDADASGPNVPRMMGVDQLPPSRGGRIQPAQAYGLRLMSVGFMIQVDTPLVWRGPMTDKMVRQFLTDVEWGELDVLLVDLPPSTGDIPLSLVKHSQVDGALIVVTPQDVALDDARKAIGMFQKMEVPVLGVVENMSYFVCDECQARHYLFGQEGGQRLAAAVDVPFLGAIPLEPVVREGGDEGHPVAMIQGSLAGDAFRDLARTLWQQLVDSGEKETRALESG
ncbi:MAG: Mrp/NBP35 family ATP-binding protein [Anaerolineae bacterium]|jgi:ATP-binding protein involved in chromosome partitioning